MTISLPETMKAWLDEQVESGGYGTISEYIGELLRAEQRRKLQATIDANLLDALNGGSEPMTEKEWEDIRREGKRLASARKRKRA